MNLTPQCQYYRQSRSCHMDMICMRLATSNDQDAGYKILAKRKLMWCIHDKTTVDAAHVTTIYRCCTCKLEPPVVVFKC